MEKVNMTKQPTIPNTPPEGENPTAQNRKDSMMNTRPIQQEGTNAIREVVQGCNTPRIRRTVRPRKGPPVRLWPPQPVAFRSTDTGSDG